MSKAKRNPKTIEAAAREFEQLDLPLPLAPLEAVSGYASRHLEVTLSDAQARALRRLELGLDAVGGRCSLPSGLEDRRVINKADAIRWLLDQIVASDAAT